MAKLFLHMQKVLKGVPDIPYVLSRNRFLNQLKNCIKLLDAYTVVIFPHHHLQTVQHRTEWKIDE